MPTIRLLALCLLLAGCDSKGSASGGEGGGPIATADMEIGAFVTAMDIGTVIVYVSLDDGEFFGTQYIATGGDALSACVQGRCSDLRSDFSLSEFPSNVLFPGGHKNTLPYIADEPYVISFSRRRGAQAPRSVVTLPPPFPSRCPRPDSRSPTASRSRCFGCRRPQTTRRSWKLAPNARTWIQSSRTSAHEGATWISTALLRSASKRCWSISTSSANHPQPLRGCDLSVAVTQERRGTIDPAFGGGYIYGRVVRSVNCTTCRRGSEAALDPTARRFMRSARSATIPLRPARFSPQYPTAQSA